MLQKRWSALVRICFLALIYGVSAAHAYETDQFNLPPEPLADTGPELTDKVVTSLKSVIKKLNLKIDKSRKFEKILQLQSPGEFAHAFYLATGTGIFGKTWMETWVRTYPFRASPAR